MKSNVKPEDFSRRWLNIITWVGTAVFCAEHYTASVVNEQGEEVFRGPVRKDDFQAKTRGEEEARNDAVKWAKEQKLEKPIVLFDGNYGVCDPMEVLVGPSHLKTEANKIWKEFEANGGWFQGHVRDMKPKDKAMEKRSKIISKTWNALFGVYYT